MINVVLTCDAPGCEVVSAPGKWGLRDDGRDYFHLYEDGLCLDGLVDLDSRGWTVGEGASLRCPLHSGRWR